LGLEWQQSPRIHLGGAYQKLQVPLPRAAASTPPENQHFRLGFLMLDAHKTAGQNKTIWAEAQRIL
jgi:hypothetical protein